ncbi:hemagglutinin-like protein, partial [Erwinia rhapontici]
MNAGNNLSITSGRDATLHGAQVSGEKVVMDVGRDLTLSSQQDEDYYDSKQQSVSAGGSISFSGGSGSVNASRDKMHSSWQSVQEQTGVFAGSGGYDITVGKHTQLDGAVIGSTATADKNRLDTGTLGISSGGSVAGQFVGNMANGLLAGMNGSGSDS